MPGKFVDFFVLSFFCAIKPKQNKQMKNIAAILLALLLLSFDTTEQAIIAYRQRNLNVDKTFLALEGYDAVSYFRGHPELGMEKIQYNYRGINYRFSSLLNRDVFRLNPPAYEPQYGGWCAFSIGNGEKVPINPKAFRITNGKLYLFSDFFEDSKFNGWTQNYEVLRTYADKQWQKVQ